MAAPVTIFAGFESSNDYEITVNAGSVSIVTTPAPPRSNETYVMKLVGGSPVTRVYPFKQGQNFSTNKVVMGFYFRVENAAPASNVLFLEHIGTGGNMNMQLNYTTTGTIEIVDSTSTVVGTSTDTISADTWYLIELEYAPSASGDLEIFLNGTSILAVTGEDFENTGQTDSQIQFIGSTASQECFVASFYVLQGTSMPTRLGDYEILMYAFDDATITPNISGLDLDGGTWADSAEKTGNDSNYSQYTGVNDYGVVETRYAGGSYTAGPKGDSRVGTIKAASWLVRYVLTGLGPSILFYYGAGDGTDGTTSVALNSGTQTLIFDDTTDMPTSSEYFQYGMKLTTFLSNVKLREVWCNLLHQPSYDPASDSSFSLQEITPVTGPQVPLAF